MERRLFPPTIRLTHSWGRTTPIIPATKIPPKSQGAISLKKDQVDLSHSEVCSAASQRRRTTKSARMKTPASRQAIQLILTPKPVISTQVSRFFSGMILTPQAKEIRIPTRIKRKTAACHPLREPEEGARVKTFLARSLSSS